MKNNSFSAEITSKTNENPNCLSAEASARKHEVSKESSIVDLKIIKNQSVDSQASSVKRSSPKGGQVPDGMSIPNSAESTARADANRRGFVEMKPLKPLDLNK